MHINFLVVPTDRFVLFSQSPKFSVVVAIYTEAPLIISRRLYAPVPLFLSHSFYSHPSAPPPPLFTAVVGPRVDSAGLPSSQCG